MNLTVGVEHLVAQASVIQRGLHRMEILDPLRHAVGGAGAGRADLQDAAMDLDVEGQDVAAQVGEHTVLGQHVPEDVCMLGADVALIRTAEAVDGVNRMMAGDDLVARIGVLLQDGAKPLRLDMAFAAQARPQRMDEDQQQVAAPHPVGQAFLAGRAVARQMSMNLTEHLLAHDVVGRVVAGRVPHRRRVPIEPGHLVVEPVPPLPAQRVRVGRVAGDLVPEEEDELR